MGGGGGGGLKATAVLHFHSFQETINQSRMSAVIVASFMGKEITLTRNITEEDCLAPVKKTRKPRSDKGKTNKKCCSCERTERQLEKGEDGKGTYACFFNEETKQTLTTSYLQGFPELVCYECDMNSRERECEECEKPYYPEGIYTEEEYEASLRPCYKQTQDICPCCIAKGVVPKLAYPYIVSGEHTESKGSSYEVYINGELAWSGSEEEMKKAKEEGTFPEKPVEKEEEEEESDCESLWDETDFDTGVECFNY